MKKNIQIFYFSLLLSFLPLTSIFAGHSDSKFAIWPNGIVPYILDASLTTSLINDVNWSIDRWNSHTSETGVQFVPYDANVHAHSLTIKYSTNGCRNFTFTNSVGGTISISVNCSKANILHELGHSIGLNHEQSRQDRDNYVTINYANIDPSGTGNYTKDPTGTGLNQGPYDYLSIMHYARHDFGIDAISAPSNVIDVIGPSLIISSGDILTVKAMYGGQNTIPVANDDSYNVTGGAIVAYGENWNSTNNGLLYNDGDYDGDALTVSLHTDVTKGSLTLNDDGTFFYYASSAASGDTDSFVYSISDGTETTTATVTLIVADFGALTAPDISTQAFSLDENLASGITVGTVLATDPNMVSLTYSLSGGSGHDLFTIDANTGQLKSAIVFDYEIKKAYTLEVGISNGNDLTNGLVNIAIDNLNEGIDVDPITDQLAVQDEGFIFTFPENTFVDKDGDALTYSATKSDDTPLPSWLTFDDATRTFSGTPTSSDLGTLSVKLIATDNALSEIDNFNIEVLNTNGSLTVTPVPDINITVGNSIEFPGFAESFSWGTFFSDTDAGTLTYMTSDVDGDVLPSWINDMGWGIVLLTPTINEIGTHQLRTIASNGNDNDAAVVIYNIVVSGIDTAPIISGTPSTTVDENGFYSFVPDVINTEDDDLTFSITNKPSWATFNTLSGELSGTPGFSDAGTTSDIKITVSDGNNVDELTFSVTVTDVAGNVTLANAIANLSATEGLSLDYTFASNTFSESQGLDMTYSAVQSDDTSLPSWISFDASTRTFSGIPQNSDIGILSIKLSASNGYNEAFDEFDIIIDNDEVTAVEKSSIENIFFIYPNPVVDELNLHVNKRETYRIFDIKGLIIQKGILVPSNHEIGSKINISTLQEGIYIFKVGNKVARFLKTKS